MLLHGVVEHRVGSTDDCEGIAAGSVDDQAAGIEAVSGGGQFDAQSENLLRRVAEQVEGFIEEAPGDDARVVGVARDEVAHLPQASLTGPGRIGDPTQRRLVHDEQAQAVGQVEIPRGSRLQMDTQEIESLAFEQE